MPSAVASKRSRRAAFDDDSSDDANVVTESATSSLRYDTSRKKARLSDTSARKERPAASPDDGGGDDDEDPQPPATQYERMRDLDFSHLRHIEEDDRRATQRIRDRPAIVGENHVALNAIIESITCINFMCHVKLHVELGPLLNFIVGENGSGKSAVLTAITLCLGGKASATNRGGSLRAFVKEGEEHANIVVRIKNQGEDAYKADQYGDSITCERWFTKSGASGFKLKSASGRIISSKKADVEDIVEWYCLQVDNPLNVLSQDNARQFLNAAAPGTKYGYFMKGTQLEQLNDDYAQLVQSLDDHEAKMPELKENVDYLLKRREAAVKLRDSASRLPEMRRRGAVYKNQLIWAQVKMQEDDLRRREEAILTTQVEISRTQQEIDDKSQKLGQYDEKIQQTKESLDSLGQEAREANEAESEAKAQYQTAKKSLTDYHTEDREMHSSLANASDKVKEYERLISEEEKKLEEKSGGIVAQKQRERTTAQEDEANIEQKIRELKENIKLLQKTHAETQGEESEPKSKLQQKEAELATAEKRLHTAQSKRTDPLDGFDNWMRRLVKSIDEDHGFSQRPVGPLGLHIQLTKPQWLPIFEAALADSLGGFIVKNKMDQDRLMKHLEKAKVPRQAKVPVYIGSPSLGTLREPDVKFDTMLRVLKFDSQSIRDHLIIHSRIDQTILIQDRREAEDVMFLSNTPANASSCLSFHDKNSGEGLRMRNNNGNFSTTPVGPARNTIPRMKTQDNGEQLAYYRTSVAQLIAERDGLHTGYRAAQQASTRAAMAVTAAQRQVTSLENQGRRIRVVLDKIDIELDEYEDSDGRLQGLQAARNQAIEEKDQIGNQYGEFALRRDELNLRVEQLKKELGKAKEDARDRMALVDKSNDKIRRLEDIRGIALAEKNDAHERGEGAKIAEQQAKASRERQVALVADFTVTAREYCPERVFIPEDETLHSIEQKFEQIKADIKQAEKELGGSEEAINTRASQAVQAHQEAKRDYENVERGLVLMKQSLLDRLAKYRQFIRYVSAQARCNFGYLLSERGFRGQLLLDHIHKKLDVVVEPDKTQQSGSGRNTKTLSGGEKSFSSICLLLAIWDAMGSPLRCLDEFDVFMDNVNRAISTNLLITAARRSVGKQFILITPNAIEGRANIDKDVKIIRLTDPRQQRIPDMMQ